MRKIAEKWLALLMAMLMLLSSMPLTALAEEVYSEGLTITAKEAPEEGGETPDASGGVDEDLLALEAVNAALANNPTTGAQLAIIGMKPASTRVLTGDTFTYNIEVKFGPAVTFTNPQTNQVKDAYSEFKDVEVTFTAPENIVFADGKDTLTYTIGTRGLGGNMSFPISAKMTDNGLAEDGKTYGELSATITGTVVLPDGTERKFTYTMGVDHEYNDSAVTNSASTKWTVDKVDVTDADITVDDETVSIEWTVKVGKSTDENLNGAGAAYKNNGTLNFEENSYALTDALPTINGYTPTGWTATASGTNETWSGTGENVIIDYIDTTTLDNGVETPYYTVYTITANYPRAAFVQDFGQTDKFTFDNTAEIAYTPIDGSKDTAKDTGSGSYGIETPGGDLTIVEQLKFDSNNQTVNYDSFYASAFPAPEDGVQFTLSKQDESGDYVAVENGTVAVTVTANGASYTFEDLEPGKYRVEQISKPDGTNDPASKTIDITVDSDGDHMVTFVNPIPAKGIIHITKKDAEIGAKLANVPFEITGPNYSDTFHTNAQGEAVLVVPATADGTAYTIKEITDKDYTGNANYYVNYTGTVTVKSDGVTEEVEITNVPKKNGTLTVNKKLNNESAPFTDTDVSFTFNLYQGTKNGETITYGSTPIQSFTLPDENDKFTKTINDLPAASDAGVPYYYKVEEAAPTANTPAAYYTLQTDPIEFDFWDEANNKPSATLTATADFVNKLTTSDLIILKQSQELGGTAKAMAGVTFAIYDQAPAAGVEPVATVETGEDGKATFDDLPIYKDGDLIRYYIQETAGADGYTVDYPDDNDGNDDYWSLTLSTTSRTTDKTATPVLNKKNETSITIAKQDKNGNAIEGAMFTVTGPNGFSATFTTGEDGKATVAHSDGSALVPGDYTITETSVPSGYLATGTVSVSGITGATTGENDDDQLTATFTLKALESATATFENDKLPTLTVTKKVGNTAYAGTDFTFELYTKNASGGYDPVTADGLGAALNTFTNGQTLTLQPGTYYIKEVGWPAGVVAPAENTYTQVTLAANATLNQTINNTSSLTSLTVIKQDSKTNAYLPDATVQVSVAADSTFTADDIALLTAAGFKLNGDAYELTIPTVGNASGKNIPNLPAFEADGETEFTYTVVETKQPEGYILNNEAQTVTLVDEETGAPAAKTVTILNVPENTITISKTWYSQWDELNDNKWSLPLAGAELALFVVGDNGLEFVKVGENGTVKTDADGKATFEDLDGSATYAVFELGNANGYKAPDNKAFGTVDQIEGKTLADALEDYYGVSINLADQTTLTHTLAMENVETYVQLQMEKWAYVDRPLNEGEADTDFPAGDGYVNTNEKEAVDHAKFHLYGCTVEDYNKGKRPTSEEDLQANYTLDGLSEYVYESGTASNAGPGMVVTGPLPGGYVYWFYEIEAPNGYVQVDSLSFEQRLSDPFVPNGDQVLTLEDGMENYKAHGGEGIFRYLQFQLDKVGVNEDGTDEKPLANATFNVYLSNASGDRLKLVASNFTTGVDVPNDTGDYDSSGKAISESIKVHELYDEYSKKENNPIEQIEVDGKIEYRAYFLLVETDWPANATPKQQEYLMYVTTNGAYDRKTDSERDTIWVEYTDGEGKKGPIVNVMATLVPVVITKHGRAANETTTAPLAGAEIAVYTRGSDGKYTLVASDITDASGEAHFTLQPNTTYYYAEVQAPAGYEPDPDFAEPSDTTTAFTTHANTKATFYVNAETPIVNVKERTLKVRKLGADDKPVVATFAIYEGSATSGEAFATVTTTDTGEGYVTVDETFPAGTYTVVETHLEGRELTSAEKSNFLLLNENKTFTFGENEAVKELELENPGTGSLTITKKNDAGEPMAGVQFTLNFTAFTKDNLNAAPAASAVTFDVEDQTGVAIDANDLITDENGTITLEGLIPGWYKLTEVEDDANANHVLADAQVFKVGDGSFGGSAEVTVNFVNDRYGLLTIEKSFTGDAQWPADGVEFEVYDGSEKVTDVTLTAAEPSQTIQLPPDKTYTVKEVTEGAEGDWFANYTVTGSSVKAENVTDKWLNITQSDGADVTITTEKNADTDTAAVVAFKNVDRLADLTISKIDDDDAPVTEEVEFQLYYVDASNNELYYNASNGSWGEQSNATTIKVTGGSGKLENIKLPYDVVTGADSAPEFFLTETKTPEAYYPAEDTPVALSATADANVTIVNEAGIQITLTKYGRLPGYATAADVLSGATFELYEYSVGENDKLAYTIVETKTTGANGQITFSNLRKLDETKGEGYYIVETVTPETHVAGSTQVYVGSTKVEPTDVDGQDYFLVAVDETVANVKAYNTPKGQIVILKRDLMDPEALVEGAIFTVTDEKGDSWTVNPVSGTRKAQSGDPALTGYTLASDSYVDGSGVHYTVAMTDVVLAPGTYTVTESKVPDKYLATTVLADGVKWETTKTVTVGEDGGVAVATFANVPNPAYLGLEMTKTVSPAKVGSLQEPDGQDVTYTLGGFNELTLPVNSAVLTDENIQFLAGSAAVEADWELTGTMTIGQATFNRDNPLFDGGETILMQAKVSFLVNGEWVATATPYTVATSPANVPVPDGAQGFKIEYVNGGGGKIHAGFIPGEVTFTLHASQANDASVVPADKIFNEASFVVGYDFAQIGSTATTEATVTATADATAEVSSALTLPKAKITKDSKVTWNGEQPSGIDASIARGGDTITYTITLETTANGSDDEIAWGVTNPVIGDVIPDGLTIDLENSSWTSTGSLTSEAGIAVNGNAVTLATEGQLMQGETLTLTLVCTVQDVAVIVAPDGFDNTAYVYSPYKVAKHKDNPNGVSFADEQGNPAGIDVPSELAQAEHGLCDDATNGITSRSGLFIQKFVTVGDKTAGSEGYLEVQPDGTINYTVEVVNNSAAAIHHLWIADTLPYDGDGHSAWGPTLTSNVTVKGADGTVYYATGHQSEDALFDAALDGTYSSLSTTHGTDSGAFLVFVDSLAEGARVTLTYTCEAPSEAEAAASDRIYYYMAVNSASFMYDDRRPTQNESNNTLVTVMPKPVDLGDTVWIDKNANGIQDDGDDLTPPDVSLTLITYVEDSATSETITVSGGEYLFEDRNPATPQNTGAGYSDGDIDYTTLVGDGTRHTYRLSATAPTGYVITKQYQPGGSVLTVDDANNAARKDDSNFNPTTGQTERFYLKTGANDLTYDLGLVRTRNLTIEKVGDNGLHVSNVSFDIYGPFYGNDFDVNSANVEKRTITTGANGEDAVFTSSKTNYLNAYAYYVVVERLPEGSDYNTDVFEVDPAEGTQVSTTTPVAGLDAEAKYFILEPYKGTNMTSAVQDKVEITNEYVAEGMLTICGQKIVEGAAEDEDLSGYTFQLTSKADGLTPAYDETTTSNEDGVFTFPQLTFDYDDVLATGDNKHYVYELREIAGTDEDIVYDNRVYTIEVNFTDTDGDGKLTTYVKILDEEDNTLATVNDATGNCIVLPQDASGKDLITFTNRFTSSLTLQKIVVGDDDWDHKPFRFTLTLKDAEGNPLTGSPFEQNDLAISITETGEPGVYEILLKDKQTLVLTGLPVGATYIVAEDSYAQAGFTTTDTGNTTGTITWKDEPKVVFTNTRYLGGLTVAKETDGNGAEAEDTFNFTVTLEHDTLPLNNNYGVQFSNVPLEEGENGYKATATFILKGGEQKVLTGIPAGTKYTVTEQDYTAEGYVTDTPTNATGEIAHGGNPTVTFKNTRNVGGLTVSKTVAGNDGDLNKAFTFTVTLTAPANVNLVGSYTGAANGNINVAATPTGAIWTETFSLKHGQSINFTGLPENTTYVVSEADYAAAGYVKTVSGAEEGSIKAEATANVAYTNIRDTGDLAITKVVSGTGGDVNREFDFTLTLTKNEYGANVDGTYDTTLTTATEEGTTTEDGTLTVSGGTAEFKLKHGQTITIKGLPDGTGYEVTETVPTADGYTVAKTGDEGAIDKDTPTAATFTNTRNVGSLTVTKETTGSGLEEGYPNTHKTYKITVDFTAPTNVTLTGTWTQGEASGTVAATQDFELASDESVVFTGLPAGTTYTISETDYTSDGYEAAVFSPKTGTIPGEEGANSVTATVTNERNTGSLSVEKIVKGTGAQTEKVFTFTLQLTNTGVTLEGTYPADINGTDTTVAVDAFGKATFTLKGGETITINGIPDGTTYEVTETVPTADGYTVDKTVEKGNITNGTTAEATFTNTRNVGGLTVTKKTAGNGLDEPSVRKEFDITVTLEAPTGVDLVGTVNGVALPTDGTVTKGVWSKTFTLKANESVTFTGLPEGTAYTVSEEDYTAQGFITTITPQTGTIEVEDGATEAPTVEVTVTNTRNVGGLTIAKIVTGSGSSASDTFTFRLELENDTVNVDGEYTMTYSDVEQPALLTVTGGEAKITLHGGQTALIEGIPVNTDYTVTELTVAEADAETGEADENGYVLTTDNGLTGTITSTEDAYQASFTNDRKVGDLTVTKVVAGNGEDAPNALDAFKITVTFTAPAGVTLTGEVNGAPVQASNTITLKDGESVKFTGLPEGTAYEVTEADYAANGYEVTYDDYASGDIVARETAAAGIATTVTNTMNVGDLSIAKTVTGTGAETEREFEFTLTLTNNAGVTVDNTYETSEGTLTVTGGEATFTLKGGETLTIYGIPEGTDYTVAEEDYSANGYATTSTGEGGEIIADQTAQAEFTNHRDVGSLKITKEVAGNGEDAPNALTEFEITVTLTAPTGVELVGEWKQGEKSGKVASSNTFTLTDGESVELTGLPTGTSYTVAEADYAANGYITDIDTSSGEITDGALRATVLNTMNVGDLSVLKTVTGSGAETDREFEFTLTLTNNAGVTVDNTYETSEGELTVTGGKATFTLKGGESLSIYGIPEGTDYTVTEKDPAEHGYLITSTSGEEGTIGTGMSSATFTNTRDIGELSIEKKVEGAIGETDKPFEFELTLTPSGNGIGVDGTYDATLYTAGQESSTTVTVANGKATFTLTHDQRLVIHEIPATASYIVRETSYALEGYQTEQSGETGTIPATGSMPVATFTNTRNSGSLIVEKVLAGNASNEDDSFEFTITLSRTDGVDVNKTYQALRNGTEAETVTFTGGKATVTLTGGETLEILDILSETAYTVEEELPEYSDYDLIDASGDTGIIPIDESAQATFTNERDVGTLTLRKSVEGNAGETGRYFTFTVFMRDRYGRNVNGSFPMDGGAGANVTFTDGYATIRLADGDQVIISGILEGTYYTVTEEEADTDGYVTTSSNAAGVIAAGGTAQVSFTNTRNVEEETTSRTVYKVWNDENDADGLRPDTLMVYLLADGDSVAAAELNEANGWSAVFDDLPVYNADGTQIEYTVVEAYTAEYYVRYQYTEAAINITNTHNPDEFTPRDPRDPELLTLIMDNMVPLGGNINMNEGDCFN